MMRDFDVMLPPGWVQFDLTQPVRKPVQAAVEVMLADVPTSAREALRRQLEQPIAQSLTGLAEGGAVAAYMSVENPGTAAIFPVVTIRPADFRVGDDVLDPLDYLVALVGTGQVELVDPVGMVGVRRVTDRDASGTFREQLAGLPDEVLAAMEGSGHEERAEARRLVRQVEYTIGVPDTDDCWMVVAAEISSVASDGAEDALDAVTEFLDAWVGTIVWHERKDDDE